MSISDNKEIINEIKVSSFFVVAALSPSFLISVVCVFLYLVTAFPEVKEPVSNIIANLLVKVGITKENASNELNSKS